jgi:hypothetical protein
MRPRRRQSDREAAFARVLAGIEALREEAEHRRDNVRSDGPGNGAVADFGQEIEGPHVADSPEQYAAAANALTLVGYMWAALQIDDDQMIVDVLLPETLAGLGNYEPRPAARLREALGMTRETCGVMGCDLTVRVLADGSFLVLCFPIRPGFGSIQEYTYGLTTVTGRAVLVAHVGGRWRIVGHRDRGPEQRVVGLVDVIPPSELPTN